jgi:hypothetical protein
MCEAKKNNIKCVLPYYKEGNEFNHFVSPLSNKERLRMLREKGIKGIRVLHRGFTKSGEPRQWTTIENSEAWVCL